MGACAIYSFMNCGCTFECDRIIFLFFVFVEMSFEKHEHGTRYVHVFKMEQRATEEYVRTRRRRSKLRSVCVCAIEKLNDKNVESGTWIQKSSDEKETNWLCFGCTLSENSSWEILECNGVRSRFYSTFVITQFTRKLEENKKRSEFRSVDVVSIHTLSSEEWAVMSLFDSINFYQSTTQAAHSQPNVSSPFVLTL